VSEALGGLSTLFSVDSLQHPGVGVVLLAIAVGLALVALRRTPRAVPWPAMRELEAAGGRPRDWGRSVALALRLAALACLALTLAGPVAVFRGPPESGQGLDLVLVVDTSGSMRALDAELGGAWRTRLDLAREVVSHFARTRAAEGDRVGLVVFGENAFTQCPLTSDGALLGASLERIEAGMAGEATALGDALALAVRRVVSAGAAAAGAVDGDATPAQAPGEPVAGRVVVLLTDGRSNAGEVPTDIAAGLARTLGVRVHAVGIGTEGAVPMAGAPGAARAGLRFERHDLDAETLALVARSSGGRFFHARRAQDLGAVYAEIDALERVPRRPPPRLRRDARPEPALAVAGGLLVLETLLSRMLRRTLA
jgi:Ca-activated chloride channel family protein